ncbi:MAG: TraB family protein [Thermoplasmatota archaeon]
MDQIHIEDYDDNIILIGADYIGGGDINQTILNHLSEIDADYVGFALCEKRFETLEGSKEWQDKPLLTSYKAGKVGSLIYQAFVDAIMENMHRFKGLDPEVEVAKLIPEVNELDLCVEFIDRDITLTLGRVFQSMSPLEKLKMIWYFKKSMLSFSDDKKSESVEEFDEYDDVVEGVLENLSYFAPIVANKARRERIEYISKKIHDLSKKGKVIGIIPESMMEEVKNKITSVRREEIMRGEHTGFEHLESIGKKVYTKALRFISPSLFILLAIYLFFFSDVLNIWRAWLYWFIAVGGMAAFGAIIGRGHPLSILTSFILAPFMSLTLIGPGWIAGYVELRVRDPRVKDLRKLTDSKSTRDLMRNNIIRVFLVGAFSNVFTWIGLFVVLPLLIRFIG